MSGVKKFVLVVEDDPMVQKSLGFLLESKDVEGIFVDMLEDARKYLTQVDQIRLIIWDGELLDGHSFKGTIQAFKEVFTGDMIASSGDKDSLKAQMAAGCTHLGGKSGETRKILQELL